MSKANKIILPLLVSILLSTGGTLKIGEKINASLSYVLSPITASSVILKSRLTGNLMFLGELPHINEDNQQLKKKNAILLLENQNLKDSIADRETLKSTPAIFGETIPIRILNTGKITIATTSFNLSPIKAGQPVVSGATLLGFVEAVTPPLIYITPLDSESAPRFLAKTTLGQTGTYSFQSRIPRLVDLPSENPITLNDSVLTLPNLLTPPNLVIGRIVRILSTPQEPLQKAEIKLESSLALSTNLVIITKP